jgi:hypothetical protein
MIPLDYEEFIKQKEIEHKAFDDGIRFAVTIETLLILLVILVVIVALI